MDSAVQQAGGARWVHFGARWPVWTVQPATVPGGSFDVIVSVWWVGCASGASGVTFRLTDHLATPWTSAVRIGTRMSVHVAVLARLEHECT